MTNKALKSLLEKLNANDKSSSLFFLRPLSPNVDFAKIWTDKPKSTDSVTNSDGPDNFYLIKNDDKKYVAIVFDMRRDLHWFVLPDYRGKGYLTMAMKDIIIPHLFLSRDEQRITIKENDIGKENFTASEKVAISLGFTISEDGEYLLSPTPNIIFDDNVGIDTPFSLERINELKKQINYLGRSLWAIQTEVEMNLGNTDYSEELKDLVNQIRNHTWKLEDFYWSKKSSGI
ncbi:N-acetyltransferase [Chryseobacterium indologenes]|uniref:GNAT family N-acetyltransferase n=1 Tax=Chryseobacterium oryzae TaxID=2929799 RepID=A0ABY4BE42_9FLAO|nr:MULTISPECIES: GNAT family N-acetyltransferase [Chryseobacterium]AYZ35226.1 N-acetyltransferase [Chryseobacterium indologenes]MEB4761447.1 GNAT family N-acetyltransferase [Chryseobacterium indologenes]OCK51407.1 hypothetical protein BA768_16580 [Chryseobacterium sp. CBo1]UEQ78020.1 GNAT family N-acetyltransferase [Chryseobacterium arthrosphaerae]UOE37433.1 GNAT family N-acetyltransferase [Chryseobacterium oryzae]